MASTITGASIRLKANDGEVYADNSTTANDVARNINTLYPGLNISHVWIQHKKIAPYTSVAADTFQTTIYKDGQSTTTSLVLVYKSQPAAHIEKAANSKNSDLRLVVNMSPLAAKDFLQYTQKSSEFVDPYKEIWYFFDLLNNGAWPGQGGGFPDVPNVGFDDLLASLMSGFGDPTQSPEQIIKKLALNLDPGKSSYFYDDLYRWFYYDDPTTPGSYPSIGFDLHYQDANTYYIQSYTFW